MLNCNDKGKTVAVHYIKAYGKLEVQHPSNLTRHYVYMGGQHDTPTLHPSYTLNRRLGGHESRSGEEKIYQFSVCSLIKCFYICTVHTAVLFQRLAAIYC
jgi:hypothetical protein